MQGPGWAGLQHWQVSPAQGMPPRAPGHTQWVQPQQQWAPGLQHWQASPAQGMPPRAPGRPPVYSQGMHDKPRGLQTPTQARHKLHTPTLHTPTHPNAARQTHGQQHPTVRTPTHQLHDPLAYHQHAALRTPTHQGRPAAGLRAVSRAGPSPLR